jgi:hypothetical protein
MLASANLCWLARRMARACAHKSGSVQAARRMSALLRIAAHDRTAKFGFGSNARLQSCQWRVQPWRLSPKSGSKIMKLASALTGL